MDKITRLKNLIAKLDPSKDIDTIKALQEELIEAIKEDAEIKAYEKIKAEEKAKEENELKEKREGLTVKTPSQPKIEVGTPAQYNGWNLKAAKSSIMTRSLPVAIKERYKGDDTKLEKMAMVWIDLVNNAKTLSDYNEKKLSEGTTTEGGYLTPQEQREELYAYLREESIALRLCTRVPMASDSMLVNAENAKASVAFTAEETDATETNPTFAQSTLTAKRLDGYVKVSNELLDDARVSGGLIGQLMEQFMEAVGLKVDSVVFIGSGDPMSGIFKSAGAGSVVFGTGSSHFSELLESNIRSLVAKINPERSKNARFFAHNSVVWTYIYGLKDTTGRSLFLPSYSEGAPNRLHGYPVEIGSQMPSTSAASTGFIAFGDLTGVFIGERLTNVQLVRNPYILGRSNQTEFYLFTRWAFAQVLSSYYARIVTAA